MTQTSSRPLAFLAAAALVSMMWFQTLTVPQAQDQRAQVTIHNVA